MERVKQIRTALITVLVLFGLLVLTGCEAVGDGADSTAKATITGTYHLQGFPTGPWDSIVVAISGPEVVATQTTDMFGQYSVQVKASGTYIIQASKTGYFVSRKTLVVSSAQTYTVSSDVLYRNTAPDQPTMNY